MSVIEQLAYYQKKPAFETDAWDLHLAMKNGENVVVNGRSKQGKIANYTRTLGII